MLLIVSLHSGQKKVFGSSFTCVGGGLKWVCEDLVGFCWFG